VAYYFDDFVLDMQTYELRRGKDRVAMEPQVFDVLALLVSNRDHVVTKDELMEKVWGDKFISEAALNSRVMSARKAIGDTGRDQRLIRTIHGRGYRFVGDVKEQDSRPAVPLVDPSSAVSTPSTAATPVSFASPPAPSALLGREDELRQLTETYEAAAAGRRQVILISGEAGLGKTSLVQAFLRPIEAEKGRVAQGQCLDHRGEGEPYMPVLEALGRLCRGRDGQQLTQQLRNLAPTWLVQMPALIEPDEITGLQQRIIGATRDRMLREIVECLESVTQDAPLVLALEDLHWSDHSTLDLLSILARRSDPARLMLLATYRPAEVATGPQALASMVRELTLRGYCREVALGSLSLPAIQAYVESRTNAAMAPETAKMLAARTAGNPLYMGMVLDTWIAEGRLGGDQTPEPELADRIPESLRFYIEQRLALLNDEERSVLEAASAAGRNFAAAALAPALGMTVEAVEMVCQPLARSGRFIRNNGEEEWPDGTFSEVYTFLHDLYPEVLYKSIPATRGVRLHREIGARLEAGYAEHAPDKATELALHFSLGRSADKAVRYLRLAGRQALNRSAPQEAVEHLTKAFEFLKRLPPGRERDENEIGLSLELASGLIPSRGWADQGIEALYKRALGLAQAWDHEAYASTVLFTLATMYEVRGEYARAAELIGQRQSIDFHSNQSAPLESFELLACSEFHRGMFQEALEHAEQGVSLYQPDLHGSGAFTGDHPGVACNDWAGLSLWFLGYPDQALARVQAAMAIVEEPSNRYGASLARNQAAVLYQLRNEPKLALRLAESASDSGEQFGYVARVAWASIMRGWARAVLGEAREGIEEIKEGMARSLRSGAQMDHVYYQALLTEAYWQAGDAESGLQVIEEALASVDSGRPFFYQAELRRLKGKLLLLKGGEGAFGAARRCFHEALSTARKQGARLLELRAAVDLLRLSQMDGEDPGARERLVEMLSWYQEGFDTPDLIDARALLESEKPHSQLPAASS
jgi:DNA-binding winged helix-turn-helix (wHTH) protein